MTVNDPINQKLKEKILKGLDLTFKKLLKSKRQIGGTFVFSENRVIKKLRRWIWGNKKGAPSSTETPLIQHTAFTPYFSPWVI